MHRYYENMVLPCALYVVTFIAATVAMMDSSTVNRVILMTRLLPSSIQQLSCDHDCLRDKEEG